MKNQINRRSFLGRFFGGAVGLAAAVAIDPEILLWKPEAKTLFIPKAIVAPQQTVFVATQKMHDAIVAGAKGLFTFDKDVIMELNDISLMREGAPMGWELTNRGPYYSSFVRKTNA